MQENRDLIEVNLQECLVGADLHAPGHSEEWLDRLLRYAKTYNLRKFIHAGDFFNFDSLSRFELKDKELGLEKEIATSKKIIAKLLTQFEVYLICGNHDKRLPLFMKGNLDFVRAVKSLISPAIKVTNRDHMFLTSGKQRFRICHPDRYSLVKGKISSNLSQDLQESIIMGHPHYFSLMTNKTGKFVCIEMPVLCDIEAFQYKNNSTTNNPEWNNGFIHIKNGKVRAITDFTF